MDTPKYSATVTVGGTSQTTQFTGAFPESSGFDQNVIVTRQSGELEVTFLDAAGDDFDISGLSGTEAKIVPFGSGITPTTLGTGVVSGAGNNIYTVTWVKDTIPASYATFPQDRAGAIALLIELDETGTADYFQAFTRFNVTDGDLGGDGTTTPVGGFEFDYSPDNAVDWSKFGLGTPTMLNEALDYLASPDKSDWGHVINVTEVTAPASPTNGDRYVIAGIGGDWSTATIGDIAKSDGTTWTFKTPIEGDEVYNNDDNLRQRYDGAAWNAITDDGENNTASNVGTGEGVFKQKTGVDLEFKTLENDATIDIANNTNDLTISLADTAVVAGDYTNADITVDAQGRITAAADGVSAGATRIIDGQFNHWDEGGGTFTGSGYDQGPTMWRFNNTSVTTPTSDRVAFAIGQTDVPDNPTHMWDVANAGLSDAVNGFQNISLRIRDVTKTSGLNFQRGVWIEASVAGDIGFRVTQHFGTGGSPSADVNYTLDVPVATGWNFYSWEQVLTSVSGKTLGSNDDSYTEVIIDVNIGSTFSYGYSTVPSFVGTLSIANFSDSIDQNKPFPSAVDERDAIDKAGYQIFGGYEEGSSLGANAISLFPVEASTPDTVRRVNTELRQKLPDHTNAVITYISLSGGTMGGANVGNYSVRSNGTANSAGANMSMQAMIVDNRP